MGDDERLVPLEGTLNFRDLGGYAVSGGTVASGRVFRADRLNELTDADLDRLDELGVTTVCDFRYDRELEVAPSRLPVGIDPIRLPVGADLADTDRTVEQRLVDGELQTVTAEDVAEGYVQMLAARAPRFGTFVETVADEQRHAVVFHCTAGKDRTGLAAMLVLGALGADRDTIVADYHLTDRYRTPHRLLEIEPQLEEIGIALQDVLPLFSAQEATMATTLDLLGDRWGSVTAYLTGPAGVTPATLDRLRAALVA